MKNCCLGKNPSPESFGKWCKKRDIFLHPDVAFLVPTKTMGCGVFAKKPLPAGTVVIECPASSALSPYTEPSADSPSIAVLQKPEHEKELRKDPVLYVVLRLLAELCRTAGAVSTPWRPWLEACPRMPEHLFAVQKDSDLYALGLERPVTSSQSPSSSLDPTSAPATAERAVDDTGSDERAVNPLSWTTIAQQLADMKVLSRWAAAQRFIADYPQHWPPQHATFELFCECMSQVSSRNFHREEVAGREGPYLLPGLDIINHSFDANCTFVMRGGGRKHATSFTVVTARPMLRGEQVYCSYGRIGLARFVVEFQFATPSVVQENIVRFSDNTIASLATVLSTANSSATFPSSEPVNTASLHMVPAAILADMRRRVELLQRMGLLFDEGFYLVQPNGIALPANASSEETRRIEELNTQRKADVKESVRTLLVVVYLLLCVEGKDGFDDVYHRMSREWLPSCISDDADFSIAPSTAAPLKLSAESNARGTVMRERAHLKAMTLRFLAAKRAAARTQDELVDALFGSESVGTTEVSGKTKLVEREKAAAAGRCRLVHSALQAEMAVLSEYANLVERALPE